MADHTGRDGEKHDPEKTDGTRVGGVLIPDVNEGDVINVSGHKQELERIFDPLSAISYAVTTGNVWPALGGTIVRVDEPNFH